MKRSDIVTLALIAAIGTASAFVLCNSIMGDPDEASVKFTAVSEVVTKELTSPNAEIFNSVAINPTVEVYVGDCEDIDRNGILDQAELMACSKETTDGDDVEGEADEDTTGDDLDEDIESDMDDDF